MAREIWVADSETDPFLYGRFPRPFEWGAYNGSEYHSFKTVDEFVEFFKDKKVICYAHNGGKFDWFFLIGHLEEFEPIMVISGRLAKFRIGECEFRDSYNILPFPLSHWKKDEIDYGIFEESERTKPENAKAISHYLKMDCVYLYEIVKSFIDEYGINLTQASAALKMWRKISGRENPQTSADFYESLSQFYYGGRVQVFNPGIFDGNFKVIDINSAYPEAMTHLHAWGSIFITSSELPKSRAHIERAFITLRCASHGAFPFRAEDGSLDFPDSSDLQTYQVTGWEYLAALDTKTIGAHEIIEVITFPDSIEFRDYVDHFYALKESSEKGSKEYIFAKLFLNSLYGKWAANPDKYSEYTVARHSYIQAMEQEDYGFCADLGKWALLSRPLPEEKQHYFNVATAASITGYVRAKLWRAICSVDTPLYCDTDSIFCVDTRDLELDPKALGAWDVEAECDYGAFAGKKMYAARIKGGEDWKTASKGVKLSAQEICQVAKGEEIIYKSDAPTFSLKRGITFNSRKIVATR